ncbi:S-adenosylhomocysteine deaminase [Deltaproteobacteria bacterium Smac51]|nr:S-adenosylhomocysteine deaminase [Deltaproteobacteria bacterium Smac51]
MTRNSLLDTVPAEFSPERPSSEAVLLAPAAVLTPEGIQHGYGVVVSDGKFLAVAALESLSAEFGGIQRVDLPGRLLMPGFIDSHQHLAQAFGKALAFGEPSEIFKRIWVPLEGFLNQELVYLSGKLAAFEALRGGITTVADAGARSSGDLSVLAQAAEEAGLRCVLGIICNDFPESPNPPDKNEILKRADDHLSRYDGNALITPSLAISIPEIASDWMLNQVYERCREAGRVFQTHVNEHLAAVERSLVDRRLRPLEHLARAKALGPHTLAAHVTLVTPAELNLLRDTDTAVAYNPVASQWKGNAVCPALQMEALGIRLGLGTDGTRSDGFRLVDAAESLQRIAFGLSVGDSSCGGGYKWLDMSSRGGAEVLGLSGVTGSIKPGLAADFLLVDLDVPELTPSWDLPWDLVRLGNRSQIEAVFVGGRLRLWQGWPVDWDGKALMERINKLAGEAVAQAPIKRVHGTSAEYTGFRRELGI